MARIMISQNDLQDIMDALRDDKKFPNKNKMLLLALSRLWQEMENEHEGNLILLESMPNLIKQDRPH